MHAGESGNGPPIGERPVARAGIFPWLPWPLRVMACWTTPIRAERLASLRIGAALFLLLDVLTSYWPNREVFFGPDSLGTFDQYEWYGQRDRHWWSLLRGPGDDLNFTLALFGALGLAVWMVLDARGRFLARDANPPRPSPWVVGGFVLLSAYALSGFWARVLRAEDLAPDSALYRWLWLAPLFLTALAILFWMAEAWVTYRPAAPRDGPARTHGYFAAWYIAAWVVFPLLTLAGYLLREQRWTTPNDGDWVRSLLEPWLFNHDMVAAGLIVWIAALVLLLIGFQTRPAAVVVWAMSASFANVQPHIDNAGDTIRGILLLYVMLCPCGAAWSVDRLLARRPRDAAVFVSPWPVCLLFIQLSLIYFMNGAYKVLTPEWRSGETLYYVLNDLTLTRFSYAQLHISFGMAQILTLTVLTWELTFPILAFWRYTRVLALIFGVGFHLGIGLSMDLGFFVPYALCIYLPLLPWEKVADWGRRDPVLPPSGPSPENPTRNGEVAQMPPDSPTGKVHV